MMFLEGYIAQDIDSTEVFCRIADFCRFFALQDFLRNRPLKIVWADSPLAVRVLWLKLARRYCGY
jgi:hypothetical protein